MLGKEQSESRKFLRPSMRSDLRFSDAGGYNTTAQETFKVTLMELHGENVWRQSDDRAKRIFGVY